MSLCCSIIGNVDSGKSTFCENIKKRSKTLEKNITQDIIPHLYNHYGKDIVFLDTPGHDCFNEMRIQTVQMSHIVLFFVEINKFTNMDIKYLNFIKEMKKPFVLIINKCDVIPKSQIRFQIDFFKLKLAENGINSESFKKNKNIKQDVSIIPISARSKFGLNHLFGYLAKISDLVKFKNDKGYFIENREFISKGTLVQSIISNTINYSQFIYYITTDMEYKFEQVGGMFDSDLKFKKEIADMTCYLKLKNLPMPGTPFYITNEKDTEGPEGENAVKKINKYLKKLKKNTEDINTNTDQQGIVVIAPTYTKLLAIKNYIGQIKIKNQPIRVKKFILSSKIQKKHLLINKMIKTDNQIDEMFFKIYDKTLFFGKDSTEGVISSENIYNLFSQYINYVEHIFKSILDICISIYQPCLLEILDEHIYHKKNPIIIGVKVVKGTLHRNTTLKSNDTNKLLGTVTSIEKDNKPLLEGAKENDRVCIKINSELSYNSDMTLLKTFYTKDQKYISKKYGWLFN